MSVVLRGKTVGNVLAEYGLILALVVIAAVSALVLMGGSISDLLANAGQGTNSNAKVFSVLSPVQSGAPATLGQRAMSKGGFLTFTINPRTGRPKFEMSSTPPDTSNTTSVDGGMWNTMGSLKTAQSLAEMAAAESNPAIKAYLQKMADNVYLMGAAQAELDAIPELDMPNMAYNNVDALRDLYMFNQELKTMMTSPPRGMNPQMLTEALSQAQDAYNISQTYLNVLDEYIDESGNVGVQSFALAVEDGQPGSILNAKPGELAYRGTDGGGTSLANSASLDFIKTVTPQVLSDGKVDSANVEATLTDAVNLDSTAETGSAP